MEEPNLTFCKVCKLNCRTAEKYAVHITTELHKKIAQNRPANDPPKAPSQDIIPHVVEHVRHNGPNRGAAAGGPAFRGGNSRFGGSSGGGGITSLMQRPAPPPPLHDSFIMGSNMSHPGRGRDDFGMGHSGRGRDDFGMGHSGRGGGNPGMGPSGRGRGDSGMGHSGRGRGDQGMGHSGRGRGNTGMGPPGRGGFGPGQRGGGASGQRGPPLKKSTAQSDDSAHRCDLCSLTMSGPESYQQHVTGVKHQRMLLEKGLPVEEKKVKQIRYQPGVVKIQAGLDAIQSELVGLQYLVEFRHPTDLNKDPVYECFLCHARMDVRNCLAHITGFKHKHTYLKIHYADRIRWLDPTGTIATGPKVPEWKPFLLKQVEIVSAAEGRAPVAVYEWDGVGPKPDVFTGAPPIKRPACLNQNLPAAKRQALEGIGGPTTADSNTSEKHPTPTSSATASAASTVVKAGEASLVKLLGALKDYDIRSDSEAELIVKIKDALASSLTAYYKRSGQSNNTQNYYGSSTGHQTSVQPTPPPPPPPPPAPSWGQMPGAWPQNGNMQGMYGYGYGDMTDYYGQPMWH